MFVCSEILEKYEKTKAENLMIELEPIAAYRRDDASFCSDQAQSHIICARTGPEPERHFVRALSPD